MPETSLSLLERAQRHEDDAAWTDLVTVYTPLLHRWMHRYALQECDAQDLVQEVMLVVHRELGSFQHAGRTGAFRAWLRTILLHRLQDYWRRSKQRESPTGGSDFQDRLQQLADPASNLSKLWDREHDAHVLRGLLRRIERRFTPASLEAFQRVVLHGESIAQVAEDLGLSVNAVCIAKSRVLRELRREADGLL